MIRVAIVGAGTEAERHARGLRAHHADCTLVGLYDEDPHAATAGASALETPVFSELVALWEAVDAIVACGTGERRARLIGTALSHGIDVLIEPPMAMTEQQMQVMLGGIVRAPRRPVVMVGHDELYNPAIGAVRELLSGQRVVSLEMERHDPASPASLPQDFDIVREMLLPDIEMVSALLDVPVAVTQAAGTKTRSGEPFDYARALLVLDDNTIASLAVSHCGAARVRQLRVTTTNALVTCDLDSGVVEATKTLSLDEHGNLGTVVHRIDVPHRDPYEAQAEAFLDAIVRRAKPRLNIGAAVAAGEIAEAIRSRIALVDRRAPSRRSGRLRAA